MKYCPNCGSEINVKSKYCPECGTKLDIYASGNIPPVDIQVKRRPHKKRGLIAIVLALALALTCGAVLLRNGQAENGKSLFQSIKESVVDVPQKAFSDDTDAIQTASASVIRLECFDKDGYLYCTGSAFAAFEDGCFVTNYHVIEQEVYSILAYTENDTMFEINTVWAYDETKDIAILKTNASTGIMPLTLGESNALEKGEKVVAIGSPLGMLNTVSTGVFGGYNDTGDMKELQFTASISSGSSGGALFNDRGEVIGITYASYVDGQNMNVAVPIDAVIDLYDNFASQKGMTVPEFYDTFEHILTITCAEMLKNPDAYCGQVINVVGYISSIMYSKDGDSSLYLVDDNDKITNRVFEADVPWDYSNNNIQGRDSTNNLGGGNLWILFSGRLSNCKPGDLVIVTGEFRITSWTETLWFIVGNMSNIMEYQQ